MDGQRMSRDLEIAADSHCIYLTVLFEGGECSEEPCRVRVQGCEWKTSKKSKTRIKG